MPKNKLGPKPMFDYINEPVKLKDDGTYEKVKPYDLYAAMHAGPKGSSRLDKKPRPTFWTPKEEQQGPVPSPLRGSANSDMYGNGDGTIDPSDIPPGTPLLMTVPPTVRLGNKYYTVVASKKKPVFPHEADWGRRRPLFHPKQKDKWGNSSFTGYFDENGILHLEDENEKPGVTYYSQQQPDNSQAQTYSAQEAAQQEPDTTPAESPAARSDIFLQIGGKSDDTPKEQNANESKKPQVTSTKPMFDYVNEPVKLKDDGTYEKVKPYDLYAAMHAGPETMTALKNKEKANDALPYTPQIITPGMIKNFGEIGKSTITGFGDATAEIMNTGYQIGRGLLQGIDKVFGTRYDQELEHNMPEIPKPEFFRPEKNPANDFIKESVQLGTGLLGLGKIMDGVKAGKAVGSLLKGTPTIKQAVQDGMFQHPRAVGAVKNIIGSILGAGSVSEGNAPKIADALPTNRFTKPFQSNAKDSALTGKLKSGLEFASLGALGDFVGSTLSRLVNKPVVNLTGKELGETVTKDGAKGYWNKMKQEGPIKLPDGSEADLTRKGWNKIIHGNTQEKYQIFPSMREAAKKGDLNSNIPNNKLRSDGITHWDYVQAPIKIDGKRMDVRLDFGIHPSGKLLYNIEPYADKYPKWYSELLGTFFKPKKKE